MRFKTIFAALLFPTLIGYIISFTGNAYLFVIFLPASIIIVLSTILFAISSLPEDPEKRFKAIVLACLIFLFFGGWAIKHYFLPYKIPSINILSNIGVLLFTIFLAWYLIRSRRKKTLFTGMTVFIFYVFLLIYIGSNMPQHIGSSNMRILKSLPYLTWTPAKKTIEKTGVIKYDQNEAFKGVNIYCSANSAEAHLIDMAGNILHSWSAETDKEIILRHINASENTWHHVKICKNGDLLAMYHDRMLVSLDWDSNFKWLKKRRVHHDIDIAENGDIYFFARKDDIVFKHGLPLPILQDYITIMSSDRKIKKEIPLFKVLKEEVSFNISAKIYSWLIKYKNTRGMLERKRNQGFIFFDDTPPDIFHSNTLQIIQRDIDGLCKKGDILICVRELNLIGILDIQKEKLIWRWGPKNLEMPHYPTLLQNGNILIFDNGTRRKYSRIVELNPLTKNIVWEYKADPPSQFYSYWRGSNQGLPNGNTLITESDKGHVFEVTPEGEVVWEFYNPEIDKQKQQRTVIYRMMRITDPENYPFLRNL